MRLICCLYMAVAFVSITCPLPPERTPHHTSAVVCSEKRFSGLEKCCGAGPSVPLKLVFSSSLDFTSSVLLLREPPE